MQHQSGCPLCAEIRGTGFSRIVSGRTAQPIHETKNWLAISDLKPIVPGHSLIVSRTHQLCLRETPNSLWSEFESLVEETRATLENQFGPTFLFEHGAVREHRVGLCVTHCHLHLIPANAPVIDWLDELEGNLSFGVGGIVESLQQSQDAYLYFQNATGEQFLLDQITTPIPSQFIRRKLAGYLELPEWNWKQAVFAQIGNGAIE